MMRSTRSWCQGGKILLLMVTLPAALLIAEILVRWLRLAPEVYEIQAGRFSLSSNPLLGYELVPFFESNASGPMFDFAGKANSLGFRDRDHPLVKPKGVYRVLVLGDSIVQGLYVPSSRDILTAVLERALLEQGDSVEVLNFGVSGYNTRQEVEMLREKGLPFNPDLVVLVFCVNDTCLDCGNILSFLGRAERQRNTTLRRPAGLLRHSALVRLVYAVQQRHAASAISPLAATLGPDSVTESFEVLGNLSRAAGFTTVVVWFPRLARAKGSSDNDLRQRIAGLSQSNGLQYCDLTDALQAGARQSPMAVDALHPNAAGHRCAGRELARYIRAHVLRPPQDDSTAGRSARPAAGGGD